MSQRVLRYSRPNAELRAMISRLLSPAQLRALAASPDLEGALRLLSDTAYRARLSELPERGVALVSAEQAVMASVVDGYERTARLLGGSAGRLVLELARRLELDNLKAILRAKARGEPADLVLPLLVPLGRSSDLPVDDLLQAEDVEGAADLLSATEYARVLRSALPRYTAERSLFPVETALDLDYYRRLWSAVQNLSGHDREIAERMMGVRYDLLNVDWIIRFRLIYDLSPEEIFNYALPYGRRVDDGVVRRAARADGIEGIAAAVPQPYRALLEGLANLPDPVEQASLRLQRYLVAVARSALVGYPFHVGVALAYLWLKETEAHDLKAVLEAKRYGLTPERIVGQMWGIA